MATWRKVLVSGSAAVLSTVTSDAAVTAGTSFVIGSADINETDLEQIDGITAGQGAANKALVLDGNADIASGVRNIAITGTFSDGNYTFDTSGNVSGLGTIGSGNITSTGTVQGTTITATTAFAPDASDGAALGTSALEFSDLYLADGAVLSLGDGGADVTFTHVADTGVLLNSTNKIQFNDSSQYIGASSTADLDIAATTDVNIDATTLDVNAALDVSGATTLNGAVTLGDASGDDITNTGRWVGDFVPKSDSAIDLGTSALQFAEAHIDTGYIDAITATGTSTLTTVDINGGNIDGTVIGAASAAAATLAATVTTTLKNASAVGASHLTGSFSGSFVGDGSNLTGVAQDINTLTSYGAATIHQDDDEFLISDNGTEKKITFSNLEDSIFANVSGDATIAAGGALTLASNSVSQAQLDDDAVGADELAADAVVNASIASNAAIDMDKLDGDSLASSLTDFAQDDLVILSDTSDSGDLKSMTTSNLEDAIFGNVSGDAAIAAGGALTIADAFLVNDASDSTSGTITAAGFTTTATGSIAHIKASDEISGSISQAIQAGITTMANLTTVGTIGSGTWEGTTVAVDQGGTGATTLNNLITLGTHSTGNYVATVADSGTGGITVANSGAETAAVTLELDINGLTAAAIASGDMIAFSDEGSAGDPSKKESIDDIATLFAGDALAASSAVLAVQVDDTTIETNSDALRAKTAAISDGGSGLATADQIHTFYTAGGSNLATAFNTDLGGDFIIGNQSSDTATFSGPVTITGNLDVNGTLTTIDSTNLRVADRFIYASSGSTSGDGGLIVGTGADGVGTALGYDDSASRWALTKADDTAEDATSITPRQYVVSVSGSAADASSNPSDFGSSATDRIGMMHVNTSTGDIFIFS